MKQEIEKVYNQLLSNPDSIMNKIKNIIIENKKIILIGIGIYLIYKWLFEEK